MAARKTAQKKTTATPAEAEPVAVEPTEPDTAEAVPAEAEPVKPSVSGTREIERVQVNGAWTCPFDDHCNDSKLSTCGKCGAVRDGNEASR